MKRNLICLLLASMFAAPLFAQSAPPGGNAQAFLAFTGGSVWNDTQTGGTCIWYFPVLGNLPLTSLFASEKGSPVVDLNHAYFVWISGWSIQWEAENPGFGNSKVTLAGIPAGTATVYYRQDPISLPFDSTDPGTWGTPVATFARGAGMFQSPDGFKDTDRFIFSAQLTGSQEISLQGRPFNFRSLMPHGITCFEFGQNYSTTETGACIAMGN